MTQTYEEKTRLIADNEELMSAVERDARRYARAFDELEEAKLR